MDISVARLKKILRKPPREIAYWSYFHTTRFLKTGAESLLGNVAAIGVRGLPMRSAALVRSKARVVTRLRYAKSRVLLSVESETDLRRALRSVSKEPETIEWLEKSLSRDSVLYDIGANVGAYALIATKLHGPSIRVLAFEPSFSTFSQLCRNIMINGVSEQVTPLNVPLSNRLGTEVFCYRSIESGDSQHGLGGLAADARVGRPEFRQTVLMFPLDYLVESFRLPEPTHLKIDVDGTEVQILEGAAKILESKALRSILIEVNEKSGQAESVKRLLEAKGFALRTRAFHGGIFLNYIFDRVS